MEARGPDPRGETLGGVKVRRGSASRPRVTPSLVVRTHWMRKPPKPRCEHASWDFGSNEQVHQSDKRQGGQDVSRGTPATGEGKPL